MNIWPTIAGATTGWLIVAVLVRKHGSDLKMIDQGLVDLDNENNRLKELIDQKDTKIEQQRVWGRQQYVLGQTDLEERIMAWVNGGHDVRKFLRAEAKSKAVKNLAGDSIHDDMRKGKAV